MKLVAPYPLAPGAVPSLTTEQMRDVDRIMVEDLGIELMQMMENAGRTLAGLAMTADPSVVSILAGSGGNGGGGLVAGRHLANHGVDVEVSLTRDLDGLSVVTRRQAEILLKMDVRFTDAPTDGDLIINAIVG